SRLLLPLLVAQLPTLFPYTTLFRSLAATRGHENRHVGIEVFDREQCADFFFGRQIRQIDDGFTSSSTADIWDLVNHRQFGEFVRSEEHTSELQSRFDLVCRLLLEKK